MECGIVSRPGERSQMDVQKQTCTLRLNEEILWESNLWLDLVWGRTPLFHSLSDAFCTGFMRHSQGATKAKRRFQPSFHFSYTPPGTWQGHFSGSARSGNIWHQNPIQQDTIRVRGQKEATYFFGLFFFFSSPKLSPCRGLCGHVAQIWGLPADRPAMHAQ